MMGNAPDRILHGGDKEAKMRKWIPCLVIGLAVAGLSFLAVDSHNASALDQNRCLDCHGNPDLKMTDASGNSVSLYVNEQALDVSAHKYIDCTTCHGAHPHAVGISLTKLSLAEKCGTCHQYEYEQHRKSIHGQQLLEGNQDVATCVDCHSNDSNPHSVDRVLEPASSAYKKNIAQTCAKCHNDSSLMSSYGIVEQVYESYMRSFHGKALELSSNELA